MTYAHKTDEAVRESTTNLRSETINNISHGDLYFKQANQYKVMGKNRAAVSAYWKCIEIDPSDVQAYNNMGLAYKDLGQYDHATACFQEAIGLHPGYAKPYNNLGLIFNIGGRFKEAIRCFKKAIDLEPDYAQAYNNLAISYNETGLFDEAILCCRKALQLNPELFDSCINMGTAYSRQGMLDEAISCGRKALAIKPDCFKAFAGLGKWLRDQGCIDESLKSFFRSLEINSNQPQVHSSLLLTLHYCHETTPEEIFKQHENWANLHGSVKTKRIPLHANSTEKNRQLNIGYISPDFRMHSAAYFIEPVFSHHDPEKFSIICYSDVSKNDAVTDHLKRQVHKWRESRGKSDRTLLEIIKHDRVDILVDLAGHTGNNRMQVFARKPAPIQVSYLGYPDTTGLDTVDYKITDAWADPPGMTEQLYTEVPERLSHGFLCYNPFLKTPEVSPLPYDKRGIISFGSFNNLSKINPKVVALWSAILHRVNNAKIVLKFKNLSDKGSRKRLEQMFRESGVDEARIDYVDFIKSSYDHMGAYNRVDIGLDTYPYHGTTTTCEALWMGVPVITMAGKSHASRVGVSLLTNAGMNGLVAETAEAYIEKAVELAQDINRLRQLRKNLRLRMNTSPLMDAKRFTLSLEKSYRNMWLRFCEYDAG